MHMLRETGGPSSFESNGGSHGRKGRLVPQMSGPAPILPIPSAFRHDPRRIRRLVASLVLVRVILLASRSIPRTKMLFNSCVFSWPNS